MEHCVKSRRLLEPSWTTQNITQKAKLIDFKLEYGRLWNDEQMRVVLADEISPDNCRLWDISTNEIMDKDRFRRDLGSVEEAYQEVARRLGILPETGSAGDIDETNPLLL